MLKNGFLAFIYTFKVTITLENRFSGVIVLNYDSNYAKNCTFGLNSNLF